MGGKIRVCQDIRIEPNETYTARVWVRAYDAGGQGFGFSPNDSAGLRIEEINSNNITLLESKYLKEHNEGYQLVDADLELPKQPGMSNTYWMLPYHAATGMDMCVLMIAF